MHKYIVILKGSDDAVLPDDYETFDVLRNQFGSDYCAVLHDTTVPGWLQRFDVDGKLLVSKKELAEMRKEYINDIVKTVNKFDDYDDFSKWNHLMWYLRATDKFDDVLVGMAYDDWIEFGNLRDMIMPDRPYEVLGAADMHY